MRIVLGKGSSGPRFTALSIALGFFVASTVAAPAAAQSAAPAVITARFLATDPAAPPGESWSFVEVDEVRHGAVPGGVLAVRLAADDAIGRRLAAGALRSGELLELSLVPEGDGGYRATAVRAAAGPAATDPLPPPLAADPEEIAAGSPDGLRSRTAAATAGAPFEHQVLEIVNEERLANGNLPPLKGVDLLDDAAGGHSSRMATEDFFSHRDLDDMCSTPEERMTDAGYSWNAAAENIAAGYADPQEVMSGWMGSPGHRANVLSTSYRELGVGYFNQAGDLGNVRLDGNGDCVADIFDQGPYFRYWTQNFGRRDAVYPVIIERELYETASTAVDLYTYGTGQFTHMRFSNDGGNWSSWEPFSPDKEWTLQPGPGGTATVWAQLGNSSSGPALHTAIDSIEICLGTASHDLSAQTVTTTESWDACYTITAGDGFTVAATGDVTFTARTIVLTDGFAVATGGTFRAITR